MAERRLRTAYILRRRYRLVGRVLGAAGGVVAAAVIGTALVQSYAAGDRVPPASWAFGLAVIALATLLPWALVRWRWRRRRHRLELGEG